MSLSILIPAKNEEKIIIETIKSIIYSKLKRIDHEIIIINDFSEDNTEKKILKFIKKNKKKNIRLINNKFPGLGSVIKIGIDKSKKDYICIFMADKSDSINNMYDYYKIIKKYNYDAVFGSRFIKGSKIVNYPIRKYIFNRIFNNLCKILFLSKYNDFTNAFKIYRKKMLKSFFPIVSENFNVFLELPLKTVSRKYSYKIIPISWVNRNKGKSKFIIKELTSKYFFTLLYCFFEKILLKKR